MKPDKVSMGLLEDTYPHLSYVPTLSVRLHGLIICWYVLPQNLISSCKSISYRKYLYANGDFSDIAFHLSEIDCNLM